MSRYGIAAAMLLAWRVTGSPPASSPDCTKIDATAAAKVLGVPKARDNSPGRHTKQPPDNMDVLGCAYNEDTHDPMARSLIYWIYTPIPKDLESEFASLKNDNVMGTVERYSPGVGTGSAAWAKQSIGGDTYDGRIVVRGDTYIAVAKVAGLPNIAAVKKALESAGAILAKP